MLGKKLKYSTTIPLRWGDMDALGHVNNATYFTYMEQARVQWLQQSNALKNNDEGFVLVNAQCNYLRQLIYPADITVHNFLGKVGRSSVEILHEIVQSDEPEQIYCSGSATMAWINFSKGKSTALPDYVMNFLQAN